MVDSNASAGDGKSPRPSRNGKPDKPYDDFPLFAHATRRWAKKIRGKLHYFGPWAHWKAALKKYQDQKDDLHAGRTPRVQGDGLTVRDLLNRFLTAKKLLVEAGELAARTFADYRGVCDRLSAFFGLTRLVDDLASDDFEKLRADTAKSYGPVALGNEIQRIRTVFKYAFDAGLIDKPIRYGPQFRRPSRKVLRKARHAKGTRLFEAEELRRIIAAAAQPLKAMVLLGINCGFGNADVGTLPLSALDLAGGWVNYPRPKTGIERRCPLWPETVESVKEALARRPEPRRAEDAGLAFVTKYGGSWWKDSPDSPVSKEMAKLLDELGIRRGGRNFYALRHGTETIGGEARDQVAVDHIMGHVRDDMASVYRERISDERLRAVTDHVHDWLFPPAAKAKDKTRGRKPK
ncbi:MAG TPA: tyrosine-type recombinase/integrase [Gemmataceae bacterium]|nr:tyrosine-type recombinase/integrase [Gemmataceae bacterium]